jgi:hypothetical protein
MLDAQSKNILLELLFAPFHPNLALELVSPQLTSSQMLHTLI